MREKITEICENICDNFCKYRDTCDDNSECEVLREGDMCPLDEIMELAEEVR